MVLRSRHSLTLTSAGALQVAENFNHVKLCTVLLFSAQHLRDGIILQNASSFYRTILLARECAMSKLRNPN